MAAQTDWKAVDTMYENPGTLSEEQLLALKEFWAALFVLFACDDLATSYHRLYDGTEEVDDQFRTALADLDGRSLRTEFYSLLRHDYADFLPLRFLKARLYDGAKAMRMLINALNFRRQNIPKAMQSERAEDDEFIAALKKGKSFVPCYDDHGRTITLIRIKDHARGDCSLDCFERYTLYNMELAHLLHKPLQDRTVLLVDLTGFSITALDLSAIKFLILNFEQYYPEELYEGVIHNAPWLFSGAWSLIKPLLRQATRNKITFTSNYKDLSTKFGKAVADTVTTAQMTYIPQTESPIIETDARRDEAFKIWNLARDEFEEVTRQWSRPEATDTPLEQSILLRDRREKACWDLSEKYWLIDPFVRPRSFYDRAGMLPPNDESSLNTKRTSSSSTSINLSRAPSQR